MAYKAGWASRRRAWKGEKGLVEGRRLGELEGVKRSAYDLGE